MRSVSGTKYGPGADPATRRFFCGLCLLLSCLCAAQVSCSGPAVRVHPSPEPAASAGVRAPSPHVPPAAPQPAPVRPEAPGFDEQLRALAGTISPQLSRDVPVRLAVLPFTNLDGRVTECGKLLARDLEAELVRQGAERGTFCLVERENLRVILEEVKHGMSGLADESQCIQAGKQLGATSLLLAAVNPWGDGKVRVTGKVMDAESTRILAAFCWEISLPAHLRSLCDPVSGRNAEAPELVLADSADSAYRIRVWTDKGVYRLGDPVRVFVETDRAGYLYLFDIDSAGNQTLLLPNIHRREPHLLDAGEVFESPAGWFAAGRPTGRGTLKAVVTPEPLPLKDPQFSDLSERVPFRSLDGANVRGVVVSAKQSRGGFGTAWITIEE